MPDRILRAGIISSDDVNKLSWAGEVFYRRLMSVVDDFGRYDARPSVLRADLYKLRLDKVSESDVVKWMDECSKAGLVRFYDVDGKSFLEVQKFNQRLRAMKSKYPAPADIRGHLTADVGHLRTEEKRNESEVETESKSEDPIPKNGFVKKMDPDIVFSIEHCLLVSLNDPRWVKANKATEKDLQEFNTLLEQRGIYEKNPLDYKTHFANWKRSGKKEESIQRNDATPSINAREDKARKILNM